MKVSIIAVGKVKESYFRDGISEYSKRLSKYIKLEIVEVADEKTPERASENEQKLIKEKEGQRILKHIKDDAYVIALCIEGKKVDSEKFAKMLEELAVTGKSHIQFIIGGSLGLAKEVTERADYHLSFSDMTFPHQFMRMILCEQIYRAYRIINNEPYHK